MRTLLIVALLATTAFALAAPAAEARPPLCDTSGGEGYVAVTCGGACVVASWDGAVRYCA